ncbi:uncharacterized protein BDZ99DRAFT_460763 [Mytilinidion resinicola]|uniref:Cell cycle control protein cwf19 n=1 Tax=Mytilinidion resinicola TaxID=574789 RepID=A0A6A6YYM0_9PEZI|nr:uncharacterized protein BDZ99DRAFT_460763 [Mytilinidion resinicola]KAF2813533.1 hypothetical protein BDZ99DRAFT_460763 [Mytilinidion resinicola]
MGLDDFEKELAASKAKESRKRHRSRSRDRDRHRSSKDKDREHRHHHSSRHHNSKDHKESRSHHEHKRSRKDDRESSTKQYSRSASPNTGDDVVLPSEDTLDTRLADAEDGDLQRDSWMQAPSSMDIDYVQRKQKDAKPTTVGASQADYQLKIHQNELNHHLRDLQDDSLKVTEDTNANEDPPEREVDYTFGDAGSQWRMTKLKAVYRQAEESGLPVEGIALERFGDLREFDEAREEEIEVERRKMYGQGYKGKDKPDGELFRQRLADHKNMPPPPARGERYIPQEQAVEQLPGPVLDQTALNKLKAQMMKAKLRGASNAAQLEKEYNEAAAASANAPAKDVIVLDAMDTRMLANRAGEVKHLTNKRGTERGTVVENEDMSIEDMVRQERRTRGQAGGEGLLLAEKIAKDDKFDNDLDYLDENATRLATRAPKSDTNLRNHAISAHQRQNRILDNCPLCAHEDKGTGPLAPVISLGTRVFLTLPTEPEISEGGAIIVPTQHRANLLECDDDEWEEIRNFMKCLIQMYHDQGRDVVFYENAAAPQRGLHAAMNAVPVPYDLGETAPAFFREAILSSDEEWTQHRKLIDTLKASKNGMGKLAFRRTLAKEMPYFHVWFELDGGMGHIVEDSNRWPKGDLFAREVFGGMLDVGVDVVKRQGRWVKGDRRAEAFKKRWRKFDWTRVLATG